MSAVLKPGTTTVDLRATAAMPRKLTIELSPNGFIYAFMYGPKDFSSLAYASRRLADATLYPKWSALVIGDAHFRLTESEASEVERVLCPLGLPVDRSELLRKPS